MSAATKQSSRAAQKPLLDGSKPSDADYTVPDYYSGEEGYEEQPQEDSDSKQSEFPPLPDLDENGMPILMSLSHIGLIFQYLCLGLHYGFISGTGFSVFSGLFGLPSVRVKASVQAINIWWSLKIFLSFSDSTPIMGYRRKYYILWGWVLAGFATLFCALFIGQPTAGDSPLPLILSLSFITLTYLIADVATDGAVVALALREPIEHRGTLQATIYGCRYVAMIVSGLVITFGFNGKEYGGSFNFAIKLPWYLYVLFVANAASWFFYYKLADVPNQKRSSYFATFKLMYERIQLVVVAKMILFSFGVHLFAYISNGALVDIQRQLCSMTTLYDGLGNQILSYFCTSLAIWVSKRYLLNVSWHLTLSTCIIFMSLLTFIPQVLIDLNVVRHPAFASFVPLFPTLIQGIFFIVTSLAATEITQRGQEAITFGLVTTVNNITIPLTSLISANFVSQFEIYAADGRTILDTPTSRLQMVKLDSVIFVFQLISLFTLALLPKQKKQLREEVIQAKRSPLLGRCVVVLISCCFLYSITGNFLLSNESTSCLKIVGGKGCHK